MKKPTAKKKSAEKANAPAAVSNVEKKKAQYRARVEKDYEAHVLARDTAMVPTWWKDLVTAARELESVCEKQPGAVDYDRVYVVLTACQNMLARNAALGCGNATAALAQNTFAGCKTLNELANAETSIAAIKAVAADNEAWPVALQPGDKASKAAQKYLREIGVGTKSVLPTASKIQDDIWAKLVCPQIDKIRGCVMYLNSGPSTPEWQRTADQWKALAVKWGEKIRNLPPRLNSETCARWWNLVSLMLEDEWEANPDARDRLFSEQKSAAEASRRTTAKEFVLMMAKRKLKAIAAAIEHDTDYRFIAPPLG